MSESHRLDSAFTQILGLAIGILNILFSGILLMEIHHVFLGLWFMGSIIVVLFYMNAAHVKVINKTLIIKTLFKAERNYNSNEVCIKRFYFSIYRMRLSDTDSIFYLAHLREFIKWDYENTMKAKYGIDSCE